MYIQRRALVALKMREDGEVKIARSGISARKLRSSIEGDVGDCGSGVNRRGRSTD